MENLLFQMEGPSKKNLRRRQAACYILVIIGVLLCFFSQIKVPSMGNGTVQNYGNTYIYSSGERFLLDENTQIGMSIVGICLCIYTVVMYIIILRSKDSTKNYFRIYENHVEGSKFNGIAQLEFKLRYNEIVGVQLVKSMGVDLLTIQAASRKYIIFIDKDAQKAYKILNEKKIGS